MQIQIPKPSMFGTITGTQTIPIYLKQENFLKSKRTTQHWTVPTQIVPQAKLHPMNPNRYLNCHFCNRVICNVSQLSGEKDKFQQNRASNA
jgi:hypothetical protein